MIGRPRRTFETLGENQRKYCWPAGRLVVAAPAAPAAETELREAIGGYKTPVVDR